MRASLPPNRPNSPPRGSARTSYSPSSSWTPSWSSAASSASSIVRPVVSTQSMSPPPFPPARLLALRSSVSTGGLGRGRLRRRLGGLAVAARGGLPARRLAVVGLSGWVEQAIEESAGFLRATGLDLDDLVGRDARLHRRHLVGVRDLAEDDLLLAHAPQVADEEVEGETRGKLEADDPEEHRHDLADHHHLRVAAGGLVPTGLTGLEISGQDHQRDEGVVRQRRAQTVGLRRLEGEVHRQELEVMDVTGARGHRLGRLAEGVEELGVEGDVLERRAEGPVEREEDGKLYNERKTTRERVDLVLLVELHHLFVELLAIVLELRLQPLHLRLHPLHRQHRLRLLGGQREEDQHHQDGEKDDRDPEVGDRRVEEGQKPPACLVERVHGSVPALSGDRAPGGRGRTYVRGWHGVDAVTAPGMTAGEPARTKPAPAHPAIVLDRLERVLRTGWPVPTARSAACRDVLIPADRPDHRARQRGTDARHRRSPRAFVSASRSRACSSEKDRRRRPAPAPAPCRYACPAVRASRSSCTAARSLRRTRFRSTAPPTDRPTAYATRGGAVAAAVDTTRTVTGPRRRAGARRGARKVAWSRIRQIRPSAATGRGRDAP